MLDRVLGGVCGGLGTYLGINPWWVRLAFTGLTIFTLGTGILLYIALWTAMPEQKIVDLQRDDAPFEHRGSPETLILIGAGVIVVGTLVMALNLGVFEQIDSTAVLPFAVILLGLVLLAQQLRRPV